jgi:hypothetical protein
VGCNVRDELAGEVCALFSHGQASGACSMGQTGFDGDPPRETRNTGFRARG